MNNRLQFRHHETIFDTRDAAIEYIKSQIRFTDEGLASVDPSYGYSLYSEPTVLRYKNEEDETDPHLILVIGSVTNKDGVETGHAQYSDNRFCFIDIDKTEKEIADLSEELEEAIRSLTLVVKNTDTINLHAEKTDDGTILSGDVKVASSCVIDDIRRAGNLMVTPDGLFIHIKLTYDEEEEAFVFIVTNSDGTLSTTEVKLPNNYLVRGYYSKKDESLHLIMRNGDDVVISCEKLIAEWGVEDEASKTPVILTKEEVGYSHEDDGHSHVEPWQDVLKADVRLKDEVRTKQPDGTYTYTKDANSTNILERTPDARYLYVDGKASNIIYYSGGTKSNVKAALDKLSEIRLSSDNDNIIVNRTDGFFASTKLNYISNQNKLVFKVSGQEDTEIQLNTFKLFENIYYDDVQEALIITYIDGNGQVQIVTVPVGEMLQDWEPQNEAHNVKIVRTRNVTGRDKVSADAKIYSASDNILTDFNHTLYVKGTADNIKYGDNSNVKEALDALSAADSALDLKIDTERSERIAADQALSGAIDTEREERIAADSVLSGAIDSLSANTEGRLKSVVNTDHSINIDNTDPVNPVISVNLSTDEPHNTIRLENAGLYNFVDLSYDAVSNKLTLTKSDNGSTENVTKEIQLNSISVIDRIYYDPSSEEIVIVYHSGAEEKEVRIPLRQIFNEWEVYNDPDSPVVLERVVSVQGNDKLSGDVKINSSHNDNILVNDHGSLYVPGSGISANKSAIIALTGRVSENEGDIARLSGSAQSLQASLNSEVTRAENAESDLSARLNSEISRSTAEDNRLDSIITTEIHNREAAYDALDDKIDSATLSFEDTNSVDFNNPYTENNIVKANVKLQEGDNIIKCGSGLYATVNLSYDSARNTIKLVTSNGEQEAIQLNNVGSLIDGIEYDADERALIIKYHDAAGNPKEVSFAVNRLFNDWEVNNIPENAAIELTKTSPVEPDDPDMLSARVLLNNLEDNMVQIVNNGLYVSGAKIEEASEKADCLETELHSVEKAIFGHQVPEECGVGFVYTPPIGTTYINSATSIDNATYIIDRSINNLSSYTETIEQYVNNVSGNTENIKNELTVIKNSIGLNPDGTYNTPTGCFISASTSFADADSILDTQLCSLTEKVDKLITGSTTPSAIMSVDETGDDKTLKTDVRVSQGKDGGSSAGMTSDDVLIKSLSGTLVEPGRGNFTGTNVLRLVDLTDMHVAVDSPANGIYLSNEWNCGKYYQQSTEASEISAMEAEGYTYLNNALTDESPSACNFNYMNNVR